MAQRLLTRNGWRSTTLAQIAGEAGVSPAGLLHHFESKEQLLHAVLDIRDADDDAHADRAGDLISEVAAVADRYYRSPELVGTYARSTFHFRGALTLRHALWKSNTHL